MALQALGRRRLALLVLVEPLLARGEILELRRQLSLLRRDEILALVDGALELGGSLLPPEEPSLVRRELVLPLRLSSLPPTGPA